MIELSGLNITNPQAQLASFGLLRIVASRGKPSATLHWRESDGSACLAGLSWGDLLGVLGDYLVDRERAPELNWADTIKGYLRERYREQMRTANAGEREWLEAYWYEVAGKKGVSLAETKLDMTAGGLKLFAAVRKLLPVVRASLETSVREALLGPWLNADNVGSLGWDPGALKSGATVAGGKAPTSAKDATVVAAMWLAFEALPLFPARWLAELGKFDEVIWVLPHRPASWAGLREMQLAGVRMDVEDLRAQGWSRWSVGITRNGKFGCLLPPTPHRS
ncbi:hypothetical protein [Methylococcus sp. EFPC2]|uniref:type I-G CRISPR-associated protein, Cas3-extension family n=1 Tax=Methylococcus sp. EFPC2 TaxID=2812648 RepID=UPI0019682D36|nr:hypothetical protein [Methylococcus sp. EFPC2]QSA97549.1 hypothetical protein JWZ97_01500 [Methylococcus sp. EFPC2]